MKRQETRRQEATARQTARNSRSPQEQLTILDQRFGVGQGATRERAKLAALLNNQEGR